MVAQPAVERVLLVLRDNRLDGKQLEHLMSMRFGVLAVQKPRAHLALLRDTGNNLLDLFRRHQHAFVSPVPWLSPPACVSTKASSVAPSPWDRRSRAASMNSSMTSRTPPSARQAPPATTRPAAEGRQSLRRGDRSLLDLITPPFTLSSSFAYDHIGSRRAPRERVRLAIPVTIYVTQGCQHAPAP